MYALEGERDFLRTKRIGLEREIELIQSEVGHLQSEAELAKKQVADVRAKFLHLEARLKSAYGVIESLSQQLQTKDKCITAGKKRARKTYETLETGEILPDIRESPPSEDSVVKRIRNCELLEISSTD